MRDFADQTKAMATNANPRTYAPRQAPKEESKFPCRVMVGKQLAFLLCVFLVCTGLGGKLSRERQ
jgi:hypothetical protein